MTLPDREAFLGDVSTWMFHLGFRGDSADSLAAQIADFLYANEPLMMPQELTPEQKAEAREIFEGRNESRSSCHFCAGLHYQVAGLPPAQQPCPRIKKIERHTDGLTVLSVSYWPNGEWETDVVFPGDVYDDDEGEDG